MEGTDPSKMSFDFHMVHPDTNSRVINKKFSKPFFFLRSGKSHLSYGGVGKREMSPQLPPSPHVEVGRADPEVIRG